MPGRLLSHDWLFKESTLFGKQNWGRDTYRECVYIFEPLSGLLYMHEFDVVEMLDSDTSESRSLTGRDGAG